MTFKETGIIDVILEALQDEGYTSPTPIQMQAIPILLQGDDLLGCAQTGTGKTAAFAVPILQHLYKSNSKNPGRRKIKALIVTPTRELAIQIGESFSVYGKYTGINNTVIFGGVKQASQTNALRRGVDVLIATPGRLLDLMNQGFISLKDIEYFVLDEADRMLDMGFIHDIKKIIAKLPQKRQSLFFSATMAPEIVKLSHKILGHHPKKVTVSPKQTTAEKVEQTVYFVNKPSKPKLLIHLLKSHSFYSALVFSRTKHGADKIVRWLHKADISAAAIHGNKSQNARQKALKNFKDGKIEVLVATDIAARGIDIDHLSLVINFDLPNIPESYVHRIGRTGRADASGTAISFCNAEEQAYLKDIQKLIKKKIEVVMDHPFTEGNQDVAPKSKQAPPRKNYRSKYKKDKEGGGNKNWNRNKQSSRKRRY
jgi:ATP-dependent RNA helicase RhlE